MQKKTLQSRYSCSIEKNGAKKQLTIEKWELFKNWQKWPPCKGYSLFKIISLGQKWKLLKTCKKQLYDHIKDVLLKNGSKKLLIFEKWEDFESWQKRPPCKGYSLCKIISLVKKYKSVKNMEKTTLRSH